MKVKCTKVCEGAHNPGTPDEWVQTFSPGKEYDLPEEMVKEHIKTGKMKETETKFKKEGKKDGKS